jgi:hypothetical protein
MMGFLLGRLFVLSLALINPNVDKLSYSNYILKNEVNHPYYVSVSELDWNTSSKQCEVSVKMFTDDFEEALKLAGTPCDLQKGKAADNNPRIAAYLEKHLQIRVNGTFIRPKILGYETDSEATWVYLEGASPLPPVKIEITNDLLYESKKEQVNIMHLKSGEKRKSFRLVNPENQCLWTVE